MTKFVDYDSNEEVKVVADVDSFDKTRLDRIKMETVDLDQVGVDLSVYFSMDTRIATLVFEGSDNIYDWECHREKVYNTLDCSLITKSACGGKFKDESGRKKLN